MIRFCGRLKALEEKGRTTLDKEMENFVLDIMKNHKIIPSGQSKEGKIGGQTFIPHTVL